jgi:hypothetical protein
MNLRQTLLAVPVVFTALAIPALANAAVVDFNTLPGNNLDPFTTYTENGFTASANAPGTWDVGKNFGNPVPSILDPPGNGSVTVVSDTGTGLFTFSSSDFSTASSGWVDGYTITGTLGGSTVFSTTGNFGFGFATYGTGFSADTIDSLRIAFSGGFDANIDNIVVNPAAATTPEPASLELMGTDLLMVCATVRRRLSTVAS